MTVRVTTLDNGLRVATDAMTTVETASVGAWIGVGARHEPLRINGLSHVLEHMVFKGTERRDAYAIAAEIEDVGGHINAYTARELTAYYAKVLKDDLPLAVDLIADIVQHATIDPEELQREQSVIVQEIHQAHDTPDDVVFDHFQETAFPSQALGRPVLGTEETVRGFTRDDLIVYRRDHYTAANTVLAASGRIDHDDLVALATEAFDAMPVQTNGVVEGARYAGGDFRGERDLEQVHLVLGYEGVAYDDEDFYAASVMSTLFGGGMSSRLFQEVREKRGLVYAIYSFVSSYKDGGVFGIYAGTGANEVAELMPVICDEIAKLADGVDEAETARSRAQLKASILMGRESTSSRAEQLARQLMVFGRPLPVDEIVAGIEAVDVERVRRVARRLFGSTPTLAALGPEGSTACFDLERARQVA